MIPVYAQDDLFQDQPNTPVDTPVQDTTNTITLPPEEPTLLETVNFDGINSFFAGENIQSFIIQLNSFAIAWAIFYSVILVYDFFFFRVNHPENEIEREQLGVSSLEKAYKIWKNNILCLIALTVYRFFPVTGLFVILVYFYKIIVLDTPLILGMMHDYVGLTGVITNYNKIVSPIIKLLQWKK